MEPRLMTATRYVPWDPKIHFYTIHLTTAEYKTDPNLLKDTLDFHCICGNGMTPNASEYSQTVPYFICTQQNDNCVANCNGDSSCQSACRQNHPCGARNPTRVTTTSSTPSSTNGGNNVVYTGLGGGSAATGKPKPGAAPVLAVLQIGQVYGVGILVASFLAGFVMLL